MHLSADRASKTPFSVRIRDVNDIEKYNKAEAKRLLILSVLKKRKQTQDFLQFFYIIKAKTKCFSTVEYCVLIKQKQNVFYWFCVQKTKANVNFYGLTF